MENKKPKVLVTYVEAGMGHIVSAQAIEDALREKYEDKMEIIHSHILRDSENPILPKYENYLVYNTKKYSSNPILGDAQFLSMHIIGAQNTLRFVHWLVFPKETKATVQEYAKFNPDVIVCTHYFLLHAAILYRRKVNPNVKVVAYDPDNNVHGWWDNRADCLYTNNPMATQQAYELRFKNGHVKEAFYPTRADVANANETKDFYKDVFDIPHDKFAVVIADGVYAKAKARKVALELIKSDKPLTVCLLAGKNEEVKKEFDAITVKPNITLKTFGFLKNAPQLYGACDLFITKAGPNAILDSVMMGTPIVTDYWATPIEKATKKLFVNQMGCGFHLSSPKKIRKLVEQLIDDPSELNKVKGQLAFFDKSKNGAADIADDIAEILWNHDERMQKMLENEASVVKEYVMSKADKVSLKTEEKLATIDEKSEKKAQSIVEKKIETVQKIEKITEEKEKQVQKLLDKKEKINTIVEKAPISSPTKSKIIKEEEEKHLEQLEEIDETTTKKVQKVNEQASKHDQTLDKVKQTAEEKKQKIVEKKEKQIEKISKKAEKASQVVYEDKLTSTTLPAKAIEAKTKKQTESEKKEG